MKDESIINVGLFTATIDKNGISHEGLTFKCYNRPAHYLTNNCRKFYKSKLMIAHMIPNGKPDSYNSIKRQIYFTESHDPQKALFEVYAAVAKAFGEYRREIENIYQKIEKQMI